MYLSKGRQYKGGPIVNKKIVTLFLLIAVSILILPTGRCEASWLLDRYLSQRNQTQPVQPAPTPPETQEPSEPVKPIDPEPEPEPGNSSIQPLRQEAQYMINLVNNERIKNGMKPLQLLPDLTKAAEDKSIDMAENNYFSHTSPTYGQFYQLVYSRNIPFRSVGENLAMAANTTKAFYLLMASELHKKNILNPCFTHIGVGIVRNQYGVIVTQLFITQ